MALDGIGQVEVREVDITMTKTDAIVGLKDVDVIKIALAVYALASCLAFAMLSLPNHLSMAVGLLVAAVLVCKFPEFAGTYQKTIMAFMAFCQRYRQNTSMVFEKFFRSNTNPA